MHPLIKLYQDWSNYGPSISIGHALGSFDFSLIYMSEITIMLGTVWFCSILFGHLSYSSRYNIGCTLGITCYQIWWTFNLKICSVRNQRALSLAIWCAEMFSKPVTGLAVLSLFKTWLLGQYWLSHPGDQVFLFY